MSRPFGLSPGRGVRSRRPTVWGRGPRLRGVRRRALGGQRVVVAARAGVGRVTLGALVSSLGGALVGLGAAESRRSSLRTWIASGCVAPRFQVSRRGPKRESSWRDSSQSSTCSPRSSTCHSQLRSRSSSGRFSTSLGGVEDRDHRSMASASGERIRRRTRRPSACATGRLARIVATNCGRRPSGNRHWSITRSLGNRLAAGPSGACGSLTLRNLLRNSLQNVVL
jgi:hypothetical protein